MKRKQQPSASMKDLGRFLMSTGRGRVLAVMFLAASVLLGLVLGVLGSPETVSTVAIAVLVAIGVPLIILQASAAIRRRQDGQE